MSEASTAWLLLGLAAMVAGFAKTAIGGLGTVAVALVAAVMPAKESSAALLLLLLVGDLMAVAAYRRDGDWSLLRHLVPGVVPGLVAGTLVLAVADDRSVRVGMSVIILVLVALQLGLHLRRPRPGSTWPWQARSAAGLAAGTTTMVANAAGPVMTLYLTAQGVDKRRFLGTSAWFFAGVNLCKLPFSVGLGLIDAHMVWRTLALAPMVGLGGLLGFALVRRIGQHSFETVVLAASALSGIALLIPH
jgi:uncharacterized membrane protein YfcA